MYDPSDLAYLSIYLEETRLLGWEPLDLTS